MTWDTSLSPEAFADLYKRGGANAAVRRAVREGVLTRDLTCGDCGSRALIHLHHDDYSQPLKVRALCRDCHLLWHRSNKPTCATGWGAAWASYLNAGALAERQGSGRSILTLPEAASVLMVTSRLLGRMARNGEVPARKVGRSWRFNRAALAAWMEER